MFQCYPKALFIWIPKTGGTSIYKCLKAWKLKKPYQIIFHRLCHHVLTFGHMDYGKLIEAGYVSPEFDTRTYKFAFIRNPYDRTVSLYFYMKKIKEIPLDESFLRFCQRLVSQGCPPLGIYNYVGLSQCHPQVRWLEHTKLDFIGRFENIEQDFQGLLDGLNLEQITLSKLNENRFEHQNYDDYYCPTSKAIVEEFYQEDFQAFNYPYRV